MYCHITKHNDLGDDKFIECPSGEAVNMFTSVYDQENHNRQFMFGCTRVSSTARCSWTDFLNHYNEPVNEICDGYVGGIYITSFYDDQRWKIQCCDPGEDIQKISCTKSWYINKFKQPFDFKLETNQIIVGLESYHETSEM